MFVSVCSVCQLRLSAWLVQISYRSRPVSLMRVAFAYLLILFCFVSILIVCLRNLLNLCLLGLSSSVSLPFLQVQLARQTKELKAEVARNRQLEGVLMCYWLTCWLAAAHSISTQSLHCVLILISVIGVFRTLLSLASLSVVVGVVSIRKQTNTHTYMHTLCCGSSCVWQFRSFSNQIALRIS